MIEDTLTDLFAVEDENFNIAAILDWIGVSLNRIADALEGVIVEEDEPVSPDVA